MTNSSTLVLQVYFSTCQRLLGNQHTIHHTCTRDLKPYAYGLWRTLNSIHAYQSHDWTILSRIKITMYSQIMVLQLDHQKYSLRTPSAIPDFEA